MFAPLMPAIFALELALTPQSLVLVVLVPSELAILKQLFVKSEKLVLTTVIAHLMEILLTLLYALRLDVPML